MKTLKEIIIDLKVRKGEPDGLTERGAFWKVAKFRAAENGGYVYNVSLSHSRNNNVECWIVRYNSADAFVDAQSHEVLLTAQTVEGFIVTLWNCSYGGTFLRNTWNSNIRWNLEKLGLPYCEPGPDEEKPIVNFPPNVFSRNLNVFGEPIAIGNGEKA